jgi:hypothetical protein
MKRYSLLFRLRTLLPGLLATLLVLPALALGQVEAADTSESAAGSADAAPEVGSPASDAPAAEPGQTPSSSDADASPAPAEPGSAPPPLQAAAEQAASPSADEPADPAAAPPSVPAGDLPDVDAWRERVDALLIGLGLGEQTTEDADRIFAEIEAELWPFHEKVRRAIDSGAADFIDLHARLVGLFVERNRLFDAISPELHQEIDRGGAVGRAALRRELSYLDTTLRSQWLALRNGTKHIANNVVEAPLSTVWNAGQILLAILIFRAWRRWSNTGLMAAHERLRAIRPRQPGNERLALLLWYLHRVGGPLAWLILILFLASVIKPRGFEELTMLVTTVVIWIFLARFAVLLIDAMAARGVGGLASEHKGLRLRSLRLIAAWALILGLGLTLVGRYVGQGAVYGWVVRIWQILSIPVVLLLIHWWRDEINDRLEALAGESEWARRLSGRRTGPRSYLFAVIGGAYLTWVGLVKRFLRGVSGQEWGRRVLAVAVRREVARDLAREGQQEGEPVGEELASRLLGGGDFVLEEIAATQLDNLALTLRAERGGGFVVLGERGAGKTVFLSRLSDAVGNRMLTVDCPPGGYEALERVLAAALGLDPEGDVRAELPGAIARSGFMTIGVDNAQRLSRPWLGGQKGMDRIAVLDAKMNGDVAFVLMIDGRSWRYILLSRGERALFQQVIELPTWSEEQLAKLLIGRTRQAGIELDYSHLVLPRQLDAGEHQSIQERNRHGFSRILWEIADGNPEVAMRNFVASMRARPDGTIGLRLPMPRFYPALTEANIETLLTLRVVLQCDVATEDDVSRSLRISGPRAQANLRFCEQNEWLEIVDGVDGGFRVSWDCFRSVTQALFRQNLMPR